MRSWLGFYNHEHKNGAEFFEQLKRNAHDYGLCDAIKCYLAGDDDYQRRIRNVHHQRTLWGAAIAVYRVLELDAKGDDLQKVDRTLQFLLALTKSQSPKLQGLAAPLTAEFFDFLAMRENHNAIAHASTRLVGWASSAETRESLNLILAPKVSLGGAGKTCLFDELKATIEKEKDFSQWVEDNIPSRLRLRAYQNTGFQEIRTLATRKQRGKILEDDLGM